MVAYMKDIGRTMWLITMVVCFTSMVMFIKVNGRMTKRKVTDIIWDMMVQFSVATGKMMLSRDEALNVGQMEINLKVITREVESKDLAPFTGQMAITTRATLKIITSLVKESTFGVMVVRTKECGKIIRCMVMAF